MSVTMQTRPAETVLDDFVVYGRHVFESPVNPSDADRLLAAIRSTRHFDHRLFLSQAEFDADPVYIGVNPKPGRNLLERYAPHLGFVESDPHIVEALAALLGGNYQLINKKVVCGVPAQSVPDWLRARIAGNPVNNLGAFVKPQYRDVTYFYGIDFHQDLIDFKGREADFVTLYIYLHPVSRMDAPLFLLEGSHSLGATVFPHDLARDGFEHWRYRDGRGGEARVRQHILTGDTGSAIMWHACTLHGTQPDAADHERISLRYLFGPGSGGGKGMARVNAALKGPLRLEDTREDLAADGSARIKQNIVNQG
jgi:hypothetical protein